ncbi:MAG: zinc-ribbon domain-containing protein [Candidatus Heimdallarchaeota archaeon]
MKYCRECGSENTEDSSFCTKCGTQFALVDENGKALQVTEQTIEQAKPVLYRRNFLLWWVISFVASPIYLVYLYYNFEDLNAIEENDPSGEGSSMKTKRDTIMIWLILSYFIPFIGHVVRYWKFDKLHKYLSFNTETNQTMIMSGKKRLWIGLLASFFVTAGTTLLYMLYLPYVTYISLTWLQFGLFLGIGLFLVLVGMVIAFYLIYQEYIWQKAMNERILMINPNAEEKQLF